MNYGEGKGFPILNARLPDFLKAVSPRRQLTVKSIIITALPEMANERRVMFRLKMLMT